MLGRRFSTIKIIKPLIVLCIFIIAISSFPVVSKTYASSLSNNYNYDLISQSPYPSNLAPGETASVSLTIKNTGTAVWYNSGSYVVRLGTGSSYGASHQQKDYNSEFYNEDWLSLNRPTAIQDREIKPGEITTFQFTLKAPQFSGTYKAYFTPVVDGITWMKDIGIYWQIIVNSDNYKNEENDQQITETKTEKEGLDNILDLDIANDTADPNENPLSNNLINNNTTYVSTRNLLEDFAPSVVKIYCQKDSQLNSVFKGSGTLLQNTKNISSLPQYYIMTNLHVVKTENSFTPYCLIQLYPHYQNSNYYFLLKSKGYKYYDENTDIAILEPEILNSQDSDFSIFQKIADFVRLEYGGDFYLDSKQKLSLFSQKDTGIENIDLIKNEDIIFLLGFPRFGGENITITTGIVLDFTQDDPSYIITNAKVGPGFSGGLAVDSYGHIIGMPTKLIKKKTENLSLVLYLHDIPWKEIEWVNN